MIYSFDSRVLVSCVKLIKGYESKMKVSTDPTTTAKEEQRI
jgi:hypothetical protein